MRVQVYPANNLVFIGTENHSVDLSSLPCKEFAQFTTDDIEHPAYALIKSYIPKEKPKPVYIVDDADVLSRQQTSRQRLCWARTEFIDGHKHNNFFFDKVGDVLPWHTHDEITVHTSKVVKGSFTLVTKDGRRTISEGDFIDWQPGEWHGFEALEDNSHLLNVVKKAA